MEILGNFAGREMTITANGATIHSGTRSAVPPGATWWLDLRSDDYPVAITVTIADCDTAFATEIPEADEGPSLIIRDCELELLTA